MLSQFDSSDKKSYVRFYSVLSYFKIVFLTGLIRFSHLDKNECIEEDVCDHGSCRNIVGSYICECENGFQQDKTKTRCVGKFIVIWLLFIYWLYQLLNFFKSWIFRGIKENQSGKSLCLLTNQIIYIKQKSQQMLVLC